EGSGGGIAGDRRALPALPAPLLQIVEGAQGPGVRPIDALQTQPAARLDLPAAPPQVRPELRGGLLTDPFLEVAAGPGERNDRRAHRLPAPHRMSLFPGPAEHALCQTTCR